MNPIFIDTNVLVYAYDADAGVKHTKAQELLLDCWNNESGCLSTQVLQEFYVTVTHKLAKRISPQEARTIIETYRAWPTFLPTVDDVLTASEIEERYGLSFWDSLIIVAAQKLGATSLVSEDLQDGQQIGHLKITNPFK
jgi:predicted nucleic acid-binding protein